MLRQIYWLARVSDQGSRSRLGESAVIESSEIRRSTCLKIVHLVDSTVPITLESTVGLLQKVETSTRGLIIISFLML
jgi:hypothetical protein